MLAQFTLRNTRFIRRVESRAMNSAESVQKRKGGRSDVKYDRVSGANHHAQRLRHTLQIR